MLQFDDLERLGRDQILVIVSLLRVPDQTEESWLNREEGCNKLLPGFSFAEDTVVLASPGADAVLAETMGRLNSCYAGCLGLP